MIIHYTYYSEFVFILTKLKYRFYCNICFFFIHTKRWWIQRVFFYPDNLFTKLAFTCWFHWWVHMQYHYMIYRNSNSLKKTTIWTVRTFQLKKCTRSSRIRKIITFPPSIPYIAFLFIISARSHSLVTPCRADDITVLLYDATHASRTLDCITRSKLPWFKNMLSANKLCVFV